MGSMVIEEDRNTSQKPDQPDAVCMEVGHFRIRKIVIPILKEISGNLNSWMIYFS